MREKQYIIKYNGKHFSTIHLTAVPGISVAKGGERELASAEVQESDTVRDVGPFELRGGQAVFRFSGGHIYIPLKADHQPHFFYYHLKDHLGSNRVTKVGVGEGGSVLQRMNYYPFGGMMASSTGGAVQPYRYTGKELVRFQGLDWLDYGARWYDPTTLRWNGVDKLAEKYTPVSSYAFCLNNPLSFIDPDGNNPIFSTSGQFLGCTEEGYYTNSDDEYKHFEEHDISYYTNEDSDFSTYFMTYDQVENAFSEYGMPEDSRNKFIFNVTNHIAKHFEGTNINGESFNLSSVQGGRIEYEADAGAYFSTYTYSNGDKPQIVARGRTNNEFEGTVEHLASCLLVHEWYGHGIKGIRENNHSLAYKYQMQDPIFYPKTTKSFKKFVKMGYEKYKY